MSGTGLPTIAGLLCLLSVPALTWASSVTVKAGGGTGGSTAAAPVGEYENAALSTNLDLSKVLSLDLSLTGTHDDTVPVAPGKRFGNSGENIVSLSAGISWSPDDHLSLDIGASYSPKTSSTFDTPITVGSVSGQQDGLLSSTVRSWGADIAVGYDTAGESAFESTFSTEASFTHLSSLQGLQQIVTSTGTTNLTRLRAECADNATGVCRRLRPLFRNRPVDLRQVAVGASYTATIERRTSLSLGGTYYDYLGDDPTQIGFFSVALVGRGAGRRPHGHTARGSTSLSFGEGVPLAPLSYSVNGGVAQELGALSLALTAGYGNYYGGAGNNKNLALRASLGLSSAWKLILTVSGNRDADEDGSRTDSVVASLGLRYRF
jgi:hypothetical protein